MKFLVPLLTTLSCVCALVISLLDHLPAEIDAYTPKSYDIGSPVHRMEGGSEYVMTLATNRDTAITPTARHERRQDADLYGHDTLPSRNHIKDLTDFANLKARDFSADSPSSEGISRDEIDDAIARYNADHPTNQIPHLVYCFYPLNVPVTPTVYHDRDLWAALQEGNRLRQEDIFRRPRFSGVYYPHIVIFSDTETRTHVRRLDLGHVRGEPFMFPLQMDGHLFQGESAPGSDRVIFDEEGVYLGALTFRGGNWLWCIPVILPAGVSLPPVPDGSSSARGFPGVDEALMREPLPTQLGWIDARDPMGGGSHLG
ncbi:hypothetical protein DL764_009891 [Monosporascus ibericus]|uniref:Uncharacterized protein n=1 Tax=Monosporascus ibericus TaxID=155417 RepID=A0A4Q4STT6_9PEZI|nr:hypothetical protein DL764_009891 [Monosporascus ibericus]